MARFGLSRLLGLVLVLALAAGWPAPAIADELSAKDQGIYRLAFAAIAAERWTEARQLAATARDKLPAKVIQWLDLTRPGPGRAFDEIAAFLVANRDWPRRETLMRQAERAMPKTLAPERVLRWFDGRTPMTAEGAVRLLDALLALKQKPLAERVAQEAWIHLDFDRAQEDEFKRRFGHLLHQKADQARLDRLLWEGQSDQAVWMLPRVDAGHKALARARMKLAASTPDVDQAVAQVPKALRQDSGLIFERARWNRRRGNDLRAAELLDPPPKEMSDPARFWDEIKRAARESIERGEYKRAYRLAAGHGTLGGEAFVEAEFLAGWIALRQLKDSRMASPHFVRLYDNSKSPITRARGAYWVGRAFEQIGDKPTSLSWYRKSAGYVLTFYGQMAASRLPGGKSIALPATPRPTADEATQFANQELTRVVRALAALDQEEHARLFLLKMVENATRPAHQALIADLAAEIGRKDYAIQVAKAIRPSGLELTQHLYPMAKIDFQEMPEPALILGIIRQESAFDPEAISPAGARGLMQLMPATARAVATKAGINYREAELTRSGSYNISLGRAYLLQMLRGFGGSYVLAAASYNAGPTRAVEWMRKNGDPRHGKVDVIDWIESIPFDETRNYVQRVIEGVQIYRARLNGDMLSPVPEKDIGRAAEG